MSKQLSQNYIKLGSHSEKQVVAKAISGDVVKKYKVLSKQYVLSEKRERKVQLESKLLNIQRKNRSNRISEDVKLNIINFLEQDCNSHMCAGKKETVTKKKVKKQKSTEHFLEAVCCDKYNEECTSRKCKNCKDQKIVYGEFDNNIKINVMKWENVCEQAKHTYTSSESENEREIQTPKENIDPNTSSINFDAVEDHVETTSSSNILRKENVTYHNGDYILVKCSSKNTEYRYVAVCMGEVDEEDGKIRVTFLKTTGNDGKLFKIDDNWYDLPVEDILLKLPQPSLLLKGERIFYKFPNALDVFEK
ncbi:unnamed protein product [Parnassius apollo]|uniref:(apollo) hypothetical protein n=1 Tax=Parnassius apollo TaxID=110799 RepID=A0A8S3WN55_PARAO|nr:unnamed protein product [Parnassius apollo]